jgi:hypothetical protein
MPVKLEELLLKENMVSPQHLQDALNAMADPTNVFAMDAIKWAALEEAI